MIDVTAVTRTITGVTAAFGPGNALALVPLPLGVAMDPKRGSGHIARTFTNGRHVWRTGYTPTIPVPVQSDLAPPGLFKHTIP